MRSNPPPEPSNVDEALLMERLRSRAAVARGAGEWFDIYSDIVEQGVKKTMEAAGDGHKVLDALSSRRVAAVGVRRDFIAHGMELSEEIEVEGPTVTPDPMGYLTEVTWPRGQWVTFIWPDQSKLEFRGAKALVALAFVLWWENFHQQFKAIHDPNAPAKRRIIDPHTPEWNAYMKAKADDLKGKKKP